MALFTNMLVGGSVGLVTGMYSIALQGRLVLKPRLSYAVYIAAGSFIGYKYCQFNQAKSILIEKRREILIKRRDERLAKKRQLEAEAD